MNRIRELRQQKGWRQEDLAAVMHLGKNTISRYETEQLGIDAKTICQLCDIFGCTADYLLCRSVTPAPVISEEAAALIYAYDHAPREIQEIVDGALARYKKGTASSTA